MILIQMPPNRCEEREYIVWVLIKYFLGLDYAIIYSDNVIPVVQISFKESLSRIILPDTLFYKYDTKWLKWESLPQLPLKQFRVSDLNIDCTIINDSIPVLYGDDKKQLCSIASDDIQLDSFGRGDSIFIPIDIFGSCFFMLTRYEEMVVAVRDSHDRFPGSESIAYKEGFLDRPIVNEYVEILWSCIQKLWPGLQRKTRQFAVVPSHDVDNPFLYTNISMSRMIKKTISAIRKEGNLDTSLKQMYYWFRVKAGHIKDDPYNTFDTLMDISEENGLRSEFYLIAESDPELDGRYNLANENINSLMDDIHSRGHLIGFHGSYHSYNNADRINTEFSRLKEKCLTKGIKNEIWGGRQHYLRFKAPDTWQIWEDAGLKYDVTLSFADQAGFRCGTCYEYPVYNIKTRKKLSLIEVPLVVMECTVTDSEYMGLGLTPVALEVFLKYKQRCKMYNGNFTILWHNTRLLNEAEKELYSMIVC